jgi:hypothetical protein
VVNKYHKSERKSDLRPASLPLAVDENQIAGWPDGRGMLAEHDWHARTLSLITDAGLALRQFSPSHERPDEVYRSGPVAYLRWIMLDGVWSFTVGMCELPTVLERVPMGGVPQDLPVRAG